MTSSLHLATLRLLSKLCRSLMAINARHPRLMLCPSRHICRKDIASPLLNNLIHELYQVGRLVSLVIHLGEVFDGVVDEVFLSLAILAIEIYLVEVVLDVFFALLVDVRSVD